MPLINGTPVVNPEVQYGGQTIPPKPALAPVPPQNTTINYAGENLTKIPAKPTPNPTDYTNNPSYIVIGNSQLQGALGAGLQLLNGLQLPLDTIILINGKKILAESQIIDGVSVFEHISRKPYTIDFDFTIRPAGTRTIRTGKPEA